MAIIEIGKLFLEQKGAGGSIIDYNADALLCKSPDKLADIVSKVSTGNTVHYLSDGDFNLHTLILSLAMLTGPAELYLCTYAMRELPARLLVDAKANGHLTKISAVLNHRALVQSPEAVGMIQENFDRLAFSHVHAKVTVLSSAHMSIAVCGSANWTVNPKIEYGAIFTTAEVSAFNIQWINDIIDGQGD